MPEKSMEARVSAIEAQLIKGDARMQTHEKLLTENTAKTQEVLEIVTLAKGFFAVLGSIGAAIKWLAGLAAGVAALWTFWPHGTPPK